MAWAVGHQNRNWIWLLYLRGNREVQHNDQACRNRIIKLLIIYMELMNILFAYNFSWSQSHKTWISCHLLMASLLGRVHMEKGYENCWKARAGEVMTNNRGSSERQIICLVLGDIHIFLPFLCFSFLAHLCRPAS